MKVSTRIYIGFGVVVFLTFLLGVFMIITLNELSNGIHSHMGEMTQMSEESSSALMKLADAASAKSSLAYIIIIISLLIGLGYSYVISRSIIQPIKGLNIAADKVSKGGTTRNIEKTSDDEIGELVESFNRMTASIKMFMTEHKPKQPVKKVQPKQVPVKQSFKKPIPQKKINNNLKKVMGNKKNGNL